VVIAIQFWLAPVAQNHAGINEDTVATNHHHPLRLLLLRLPRPLRPKNLASQSIVAEEDTNRRHRTLLLLLPLPRIRTNLLAIIVIIIVIRTSVETSL
jgi:hypothetical protein